MKKQNTRLIPVILVLVSLSIASIAEARIGGGRSSGFRGSRSFGTRSYSTSPSRRSVQPNYSPSHESSNPSYSRSSSPTSGGFLRGLMGGIAGGFIGSMLFRGLGHAGFGHSGFGGGGFGLVELLVIGGLVYFGYRLLTQKKPVGFTKNFVRPNQTNEIARNVDHEANGPSILSSEEERAQALSAKNPSFDLWKFKDERMDDFMKLQVAWNRRDLSIIETLLEPEIKNQLEADVQELKNQSRVNKIENVAIRSVELVEAWEEYGKEYSTLRFRANLVDYVVDESSGQVVQGSKNDPVKFEEDWTFVRRPGKGPGADHWKLSAIEA